MSAHTPGPWTAYEMTHYGEPGTGFWHVDPIGEPDDTWTEADARLVSAAPDLLDALKAVLVRAEREYQELMDGLFGSVEDWHETESARAAIAKAEGRS